MAINFDHQRDRISSSSGNITVNTVGALGIPVGNTAQRPQISAGLLTGQIRFNSQLQSFEGYNGTGWSSLGGTVDVDQDTKITAESAPGADEDQLSFFNAGNLSALIDASGDTFLYGNLDVAGNVTIGGNITIGDADTDNININADLNSNLIPNLNDTFDIGSSGKAWKDIYLTEDIIFQGGEAENQIQVPSNQLDALSIVDDSGRELVRFDSNVYRTHMYGVVEMDSNKALILPVGNTAQRPAAETGMIRYNTDDNRFEAYDGFSWTGVGGVIDTDQDTYITAEENPDDDTLRFYTGGVEVLSLDQTSLTLNNISFNGDIDGGTY